MATKQRLIQLFDLPKNELFIEDFQCALQVKFISLFGRMFVAEHHICFYATAVGITNKKVLKVEDITDIQQKDGIVIVVNQQTYTFKHFNNKKQAYAILHSVWKGEPPDDESNNDSNEDENKGKQVDKSILENTEIEILDIDQNQNNENTEVLKMICPLSPQQFFDKFFGDNADCSWAEYQKKKGTTDIVIQKWQQSEELGEGKFTREINAVIKLQGVPFKDKSRLHKMQIYKQKDNSFEIKTVTKAIDVPYSSYFQTEDCCEITPVEGQNEKCQVRYVTWVVFFKSTSFKNTIQTRSIEGSKEDLLYWKEFVIQTLQKNNNKSASQENVKLPELEICNQIPELLQLHNQSDSNLTNVKQQNPKKILPIIGKDAQVQVQLLTILIFLLLLVIIVIGLCFATLYHQNTTLKETLLKMASQIQSFQKQLNQYNSTKQQQDFIFQSSFNVSLPQNSSLGEL